MAVFENVQRLMPCGVGNQRLKDLFRIVSSLQALVSSLGAFLALLPHWEQLLEIKFLVEG